MKPTRRGLFGLLAAVPVAMSAKPQPEKVTIAVDPATPGPDYSGGMFMKVSGGIGTAMTVSYSADGQHWTPERLWDGAEDV